MKKFALAAATAAALTTAAPVAAQDVTPFVGTQGLGLGLGGGLGITAPTLIIGGIVTAVAITAASDTN